MDIIWHQSPKAQTSIRSKKLDSIKIDEPKNEAPSLKGMLRIPHERRGQRSLRFCFDMRERYIWTKNPNSKARGCGVLFFCIVFL